MNYRPSHLIRENDNLIAIKLKTFRKDIPLHAMRHLRRRKAKKIEINQNTQIECIFFG